MFCPSCGANNSTEQKFCRSCGFNLEQSARSLLEQIPSAQSAILLKRQRSLEKFGGVAFVGLGITLSLGLLGVLYYIFMLTIWSGKNIPLGIILMLLTVFSAMALTYIYLNESEKDRSRTIDPELAKELEKSVDTGKLLEEGSFQPATVTERTTDLLYTENKTRKL